MASKTMIHESVREIINKASESEEVFFTYKKKDGSVRKVAEQERKEKRDAEQQI